MAFLTPDAWPGILRGAEIFEAVGGMNLPIAGFIDEARNLGHDLRPTLWASSAPSGPVTEAAFEAIADDLIARIAGEGPVDAVFLDLHGAMVCAHLDDGEGELFARLRGRIGATPVVAMLDFHANVTRRMVANSELLLAYRTYPQVDMSETGARAARSMARVAARVPSKALRQVPYLIPLHMQSTLTEPMAGLMARVERLEAQSAGIVCASVVGGFSMADIPEAGPAALVYAEEQAIADAEANRLLAAPEQAEHAFSDRLYAPEDAVGEAISAGEQIILADTQDNPGAGGSSDTTGLLRALLRQDAPSALLGMLCDPEAAAAAHTAGTGARVTMPLGGKSGGAGGPPIETSWDIEATGHGDMTGTGPFCRGCRMQLEPMARLRNDGVQVIVPSRRQQAADQSLFRNLGAEPADWQILALKSSVHFRADFGALADHILIVAAEGENMADPHRLRYRRLRDGLRIMPCGPAFVAG